MPDCSPAGIKVLALSTRGMISLREGRRETCSAPAEQKREGVYVAMNPFDSM